MPILHYHEPNLISFRNKAERSPFHLLTSLNGPGLLTSWRFPPGSFSQLGASSFYLLCTRGETRSQPAGFSPGVLKDC